MERCSFYLYEHVVLGIYVSRIKTLYSYLLSKISSPVVKHDMMMPNMQQQLHKQDKLNTLPTTATYTIPSLQPTTNKVQIDRLKIVEKSNKIKRGDGGKKAAKLDSKRPRVEHVVIEKRYRMKITDSLNELRNMLPGADDKKV